MLDLDELGVVHSNTTNMTLFYAIYKQLDYSKPPLIDDELLRHIDPYFEQKNIDWNQGGGEEGAFSTGLTVPAKNCEAKDFDVPPERQQKIIDNWEGWSLLCPDLKDGQGFQLLGD